MTYLTYFIKYGSMFKISPLVLMSLCHVESNLKNVVNPSDKGSKSYGVCQIKRATADMLGHKKADLMIPEHNIKVAAHYLSNQLARYDGNYHFAIAAYNAGKVRLDDQGRIKNKKYVKKVKTSMERFKNEIVGSVNL